MLAEKVRSSFHDIFGELPTMVIRAPGRINLIGEHTDYNDGFVMPGAIDHAIYIAMALSVAERSTIKSLDYNEEISFFNNTLIESEQSLPLWAKYIVGVCGELKAKNQTPQAFNAVFLGDIPIGAGLSSSAALSCGFAYGLNQLWSAYLPKLELARIAQLAEHNYVGVMCGLLDQFASLFGQEDQVLSLDCQSLAHQYHTLGLGNYQLVLINSMVSHELASSEYNTRREECIEGVRILAQHKSSIQSLRDVRSSDLAKVKDEMPSNVYNRCKYVVEENRRVQKAIACIENQDVVGLGRLLYQTHLGLSQYYEVSCEELDFLVAQVTEEKEVIGARMVGGGFGGCTLNIIKKTAVEKVLNRVGERYHRKYQKNIEIYPVHLSQGVTTV